MALLVHFFHVELEFRMLVYAERKKRAAQDPEKNPRSKDENWQQTQPTCDAMSGNQTRAREASVLTAVPAPGKYGNLFCLISGKH